jgi:hypothetical protein
MQTINPVTTFSGVAPNRSMAESEFAPLADLFAAWMTALAPDMNLRIGEMNSLATELQALGLISTPMTFSSTTTDADPGTGVVRLGNATQDLSTVMRVDLADVNGVDITSLLLWASSSTSTGSKSVITLAHRDTPQTKFLKFNVTAMASPAGYRNFTVSIIASSAASPFADGDPLTLIVNRTADAGMTEANYQNQTPIAATTGGTLTAYTLTVTPAIAAYTEHKSFFVRFHVASGASPTLQISGLATPPNLVKQLADGTYANIAAGEIPINHRSRVTLISATQALVEVLPMVPGAYIGRQVFTASGTYTPTPGTRWIEVEGQAPGGGSGGVVATTAGQWAGGNGGGGGGYGRKRITSGFAGTTVTIGAPGAAGGNTGTAGGTGGTTSFGAFLSCTGGAGGAGMASVGTGAQGINASGASAAGGIATGADYHRPGDAGRYAQQITTGVAFSGGGGASFYGPGGASNHVVNNNAAGLTPTGYGGGAAGPLSANGAFGALAGVVGAPGIVIVHEYA